VHQRDGEQMYQGKSIAVIIPAYNEEHAIAGVIKAIPDSVDKIVVIDDCSTDGTAQEARNAGAEVITHHVNLGVGAAFHSGVEYVLNRGYDIMVNIDADGQFSPSDIPRLIAPLVEEKADFVTASRFIDPGCMPEMPWINRWGNRQMSKLISTLTGTRFYDVSCGFRAYTLDTLMNMNLLGRFTYTQETFLELAFKNIRIKEVPVPVKYFKDRKSRVSGNIPRYMYRTSKIILRTYRDYMPLRFFWGIGLFLLMCSCFFGAILLVHYIREGRFSGQIWSGFVGGFFFINAMAFFIVGLVADMFDRIRRNQEKIIIQLRKMRPTAGKKDDTHNPRN